MGLIGQWLKAAVVVEDTRSYPARGSPQGGVGATLLATICWHEGLAAWCAREVNPRMKGRCCRRR
jgi:hypothetical protein